MNIVITGGPCSGKTTLINALEKKGIHVIHEVAIKVIFLNFTGVIILFA
ncbi:MAG: AAA family ATPase, partial [Pseudomonadales bacterium]|nr:AAA family ATPase [Pseudomonadales bacterium]